MPVIVASDSLHPFLPSLGSPAAIEWSRALRQDIRPLEIAILNLMADKQATERQLALWLGNTPLQIHLTFIATDSYTASVQAGHRPRSTPADHIRQFYSGWSEIKHRKFDGLIVTGVNALQERVELETIWPEVQQILDWSTTHVFSSLFLCWGAKAALKHFHNIDSIKGKRKTFGLFDHRLVTDSTGLLFGFPDTFRVPVARWKNPVRAAVEACKALEIVADSTESGPNIMVEAAAGSAAFAPYARRAYILNHPEYETETLHLEYTRDHKNGLDTPFPRHYYPDDNPANPPINSWRHTAHLYGNWVRMIYEATPYELEQIPQGCAA